jgi:hypothetical protein|nr:MAG TPA: hypothetical protein [Caudoviricetes sp.]
MSANDNSNTENLYYGDKRLDALHEAIMNEIYERAGGKIPVLAVVGLLEKIKIELMSDD